MENYEFSIEIGSEDKIYFLDHALTAAFRDYLATILQKQKKPSVLVQLKKFKAFVKSISEQMTRYNSRDS